ncbi:type II restriction endonuclease [Sphingomonas sp. LB-2]|uniref:type II restriction endonuclease n=1 Tax=Sphingomonas caeni TaxID=2984949 RepID=UPI00222E0D24|nr:type II restriction endonuclease [Sphingomonas caeni]MCW3846436.1 type II restriction endonuclease [Sphingomonas caeni]
MKKGFLSDYFDGVAVKRLTDVEADPAVSNQHEFGTTRAMREFLGAEYRKFDTTYVWFGGEQEGVPDYGSATMYDSRANQPHRAAEWRVYYDSNSVTALMEPGDTLFIAKRSRANALLIIIARQGCTIEHQLLWLFGIDSQPTFEFQAKPFENSNDAEIDFTARFILDELGIEFEDPNANTLDEIIKPFGLNWPKTAPFSKLARQTLPEVDAVANPDLALMAWLDHEEAMFRRLERKIVGKRLEAGFMENGEADVDGFIKFSLGVQNRRKSRMGHSFENQLAALFEANGLLFSRQAVTELGNKPDFLFPGQAAYSDPDFPENLLTMLAAKSVCKERWRQILPEAARVKQKYLVTIETGISEAQTSQMQANGVQLVVPVSLHGSYTVLQRTWLLPVGEFLKTAAAKQAQLPRQK